MSSVNVLFLGCCIEHGFAPAKWAGQSVSCMHSDLMEPPNTCPLENDHLGPKMLYSVVS